MTTPPIQTQPTLPPTNKPVLDDNGQFTLSWRLWLQSAVGNLNLTPTLIAALEAAVAAAAAQAAQAVTTADKALAVAESIEPGQPTVMELLGLSALDQSIRLTQGVGITLSPNPIVGSGSIALTVPVVVSNGGTARTSLTAHGVLVGEGSAAVNITAPGSSGQILIGQGIGADPLFQAVSGAAHLSAAGVLTLVTVNTSIGTFGSASAIPVFTVNNKGLITAVTTAPVGVTLPTTVTNLPAGTNGQRGFVSNSNTTTFAAPVAGGGANQVPVYYDGAWKVG